MSIAEVMGQIHAWIRQMLSLAQAGTICTIMNVYFFKEHVLYVSENGNHQTESLPN